MDDRRLKVYAYNCFIGKRGYTLEKAATNFPLNYPKIMMFYYEYVKEQRRNLYESTSRVLLTELRITLNRIGQLILSELKNFNIEFEYLSSLDSIYDGSKSEAEIKEFEKESHSSRLRAYANAIELSNQVIKNIENLREILSGFGTKQYADYIAKCDRQLLLERRYRTSTVKAYNAEYKIKY